MSGQRQSAADFDFDYWRELAETNAWAFERQRRQVIDEFIEALSDPGVKERLRRLQWRVDAERARSTHPLGSCIRLYNMMWASVDRYCDLVHGLAGSGERGRKSASGSRSAAVLPFRAKARLTT